MFFHISYSSYVIFQFFILNDFKTIYKVNLAVEFAEYKMLILFYTITSTVNHIARHLELQCVNFKRSGMEKVKKYNRTR